LNVHPALLWRRHVAFSTEHKACHGWYTMAVFEFSIDYNRLWMP
jgi:hypothetical protein